MWTEVVDRRRKLWTEVVDKSCRLKLWTDPFGLINRSFSIELDLMELKMKCKFAKEYSNLKTNGYHSTKVTKCAFEFTTLRFSRAMPITWNYG